MSQLSGLDQPFSHALPVSQALFQEPIYLTHVGWERVRPREPYSRNDPPFFSLRWNEGRTLPEFCLAMALQGAGEYKTHKHGGRIEAGTAFFYRPGEWHRHRPLTQSGWTIMWIHLNGNTPIRWMKNEAYLLNGNLVALGDASLFRAQFERLVCTAQAQHGQNSFNLGLQALGLLSHFVSDAPAVAAWPTQAGGDASIERVVEYIWNFSHGVVDVPTLADLVKTPRRTLDRRFRARTGRSILDEIQLCRVSRAAMLLKETSLPIKHIVYRAGFRSEEHLRLTFQKEFGCSPGTYRRRS
jgi:AraC-like DNA-binding protein